MLVHLRPAIEHRKAAMKTLGDDWNDKPVCGALFCAGHMGALTSIGLNDMLQWLLDEAALRKTGDFGVAERVLRVNFAAIHTSSTVGALSSFGVELKRSVAEYDTRHLRPRGSP